MNSMETISINSGHIADAIDSQLIMLVKTIQVENKASFDDALETGREFLCKKQVEFMDDKSKDNLRDICASIKKKIKTNPNDETARQAYNVLKYFGLFKLLD